jgi:hypothetical protein
MGNVGHMVASRSSSKITKKLNLQPILNIELFSTLIESELGVLGIVKKLAKDVVHLWWRKFGKINFFSSYKLPKQQTTTFGFQRNFRG